MHSLGSMLYFSRLSVSQRETGAKLVASTVCRHYVTYRIYSCDEQLKEQQGAQGATLFV